MRMNTGGFNLLTALAGSSPTKAWCCLVGSSEVINGAITGGKPGHRIFYSLSDCVMIFHRGEGRLLLFIAASFFLFLQMERKGEEVREEGRDAALWVNWLISITVDIQRRCERDSLSEEIPTTLTWHASHQTRAKKTLQLDKDDTVAVDGIGVIEKNW